MFHVVLYFHAAQVEVNFTARRALTLNHKNTCLYCEKIKKNFIFNTLKGGGDRPSFDIKLGNDVRINTTSFDESVFF